MPATVQGIRLLSRKDLFSNRLFDLSLLVTSAGSQKLGSSVVREDSEMPSETV